MSDIVLSNLTDLLGQIVHLIVNCALYTLASLIHWALQIFDVPYTILSSVYNSLLTLVSIFPDVVNSGFGWILNQYPSFMVLVTIAIGILGVHLILEFIQFLWRVLPVL